MPESVAEQRAIRGWLVGELSRIPLYAGENILGRDDGVTMVDDTTVSRRHARVVVDADGVTIEDLRSRNGTWLADQPLTGRAPVREGDAVRLGSARFTYRPVAGTDSTQPVNPEHAAVAPNSVSFFVRKLQVRPTEIARLTSCPFRPRNLLAEGPVHGDRTASDRRTRPRRLSGS